jgi:2-dehydropantoate 2-reductase
VSILRPARFTETGQIVAGGDPQVGVVTVGRFTTGVDATRNRIAADLYHSGYLAEQSSDIRRWKSAKLLHNVRNVLELFQGPADLRGEIGEALQEEARRTLQAAGYRIAIQSERTVDISKWSVAQNAGIHPGQQSTWQSFIRGSSSEVDFLNGEIVMLGRLHGILTPYNEAVQAIAGELEQGRMTRGELSLDTILPLVERMSNNGKSVRSSP